MGVYIKGMEMPKNCDDCLLDADCPHDQSMDGYKMQGGRPRTCPLVPVPPHGDLIDRDALMRHKGDCYDANGHLLYAVGTGNILFAPTIIEAEEGE